MPNHHVYFSNTECWSDTRCTNCSMLSDSLWEGWSWSIERSYSSFQWCGLPGPECRRRNLSSWCIVLPIWAWVHVFLTFWHVILISLPYVPNGRVLQDFAVFRGFSVAFSALCLESKSGSLFWIQWSVCSGPGAGKKWSEVLGMGLQSDTSTAILLLLLSCAAFHACRIASLYDMFS